VISAPPRVAPVGNAAGLTAAVAQLEAGALTRDSWFTSYDEEADVARVRRSGAGPAMSYESPAHPDFVVRLDIATGELTGIDLMDVRASFKERTQLLLGLGTALAAVSEDSGRSPGVDPVELVSSFVALSPVSLAG
jgi:hypothetical protein